MPNRSSHSEHITERTCVICKKKIDRKLLLNFYLMNSEIVFDIGNRIRMRKSYVCHEQSCIEALDKWLSRQQRKKNLKSHRTVTTP